MTTMRTVRSWKLTHVVPALFILVGGCGDSSGPGTGTNTGNANFAATIDGARWTSISLSTQANASANGTYSISGGNSAGAALSLILYNIAGPGTYPLGVNATLTGGIASYSIGANGWSTPGSGADGTVTVTTATSTRLAGTFSFVGTSPTTGTSKSVTSGTFDLPVVATGNIAVADNKGGSVTGTIGGVPWTAATGIVGSTPATGTLGLALANSVYNITVIVSGVTGVGTYAMNTGVSRYFTLTQLGTTKAWGGTAASASGNLVITSLTSTRIKGTYNVTLLPLSSGTATGTQTLVGTFDLGLP